MRNGFLLIAGDGKDGSMLMVARVLLLPRLNSQTDRCETDYVFLQCMESTPALDEVDKELCSLCLRWSTTDVEDKSAVGGEGLNDKTELNGVEWFEAETFSAIRGVMYVVPGRCGTSTLSTSLQWTYHHFYMSRFYRDSMLKLGYRQREE